MALPLADFGSANMTITGDSHFYNILGLKTFDEQLLLDLITAIVVTGRV